MSNQIILLVEDNADDEALIRRAFEKNDIRNEVVIARDGVEALDYLFATGTSPRPEARRLPALTLLDLKLPKLDGLDVLRRVRAAPRTRLLPVIILSSSNQECDVIESYRSGANSYVRKAVDFAQFSETIGALAHYWLHLNIAAPRSD